MAFRTRHISHKSQTQTLNFFPHFLTQFKTKLSLFKSCKIIITNILPEENIRKLLFSEEKGDTRTHILHWNLSFWFIRLFLIIFLLLFKYTCLHFPSTMPPDPTPHWLPPLKLPPLALSSCPLYLFLDGPSPVFSHYPSPPSPLDFTTSIILISNPNPYWHSLARVSYGICLEIRNGRKLILIFLRPPLF